jgi:hypothetical protein
MTLTLNVCMILQCMVMISVFRNEAWRIEEAKTRLQYTISDPGLNCIVAKCITADSSSHSCF